MCSSLEKLKKTEIQERLRENGLKVTGDKKTLVDRLMSVVFTPVKNAPSGTQHDPEEIFSDTLDNDNSETEVSNGAEGAVGGVRGATVISSEAPVSIRDLEHFRKEMLDSMTTLIRAALLAHIPAPLPPATNPHGDCYTQFADHPLSINAVPYGPPTVPPTIEPAQLQMPAVAQIEPQPTATAQLLPPNNLGQSLITTAPRCHPPATEAGNFQLNLVTESLANCMSSENTHQNPSNVLVQQARYSGNYENPTNPNAQNPHYHHRFAVMQAAENMPEFDPHSEFGKTKSAKVFLTRIRQLQQHYGYSDFLILEAAQQRLRGEAKRWNEESPELYTTFDAFEADLLATYPSCTTKADVLEEIFTAKRASNEGLEAFCHRIIIVGRRAQLPDHDLAQFILKRIDHTQFLTAVACVPIVSTTELLRAVASFVQKMPTNGNANENIPNTAPTTLQPNNRPNQTNIDPRCWNCRGNGHNVNTCPQPQLKCTNCQRFGHLAQNCRYEKRPTRIFRIDGDNGGTESGVRFEKIVKVNGESLTAYIDGGSRWSLIGRSVAESLGEYQELQKSVCAKGFAGDPVACTKKITLRVIVDDQEFNGDLHIVDDDYLDPSQLLLGTDLLCGVGRFILIGENECRMLPSLVETALKEIREHPIPGVARAIDLTKDKWKQRVDNRSGPSSDDDENDENDDGK